MLSQLSFAPHTSNGTPIKSTWNLLENRPPKVIGKGTVGDVLEKTIFSWL
ncbi:hypothetical protein protein [Bacillus cereus G9241]|nr:hypothetical protein protein [Bacillus cereus G9241]